MALPLTSYETLFWSRVKKADGCWIWQGGKDRDGYGRLQPNENGKSRALVAHRIAYEIAHGSIAEGFHVHHKCGNKGCVNPDHLEALSLIAHELKSVKGTAAVNGRKTHCASGHAYDAGNTYIDRDGWRHCRACQRVRDGKRVRVAHRSNN